MTVHLKKPAAGSIPIVALDSAGFDAAAAALPPAQRRWLQTLGFRAMPDTHALLPGDDGALAAVWAGVRRADQPWSLALLPRSLPAGRYHLGDAGLAMDPAAVAMAWQLGGYVFNRYKPRTRELAQLHLAPSAGAEHGLLLADAIARVRDLVNTPAEHMGPEQLGDAAAALAKTYRARCRQIVGDALLKQNFPAIHAVGRAA
ncbi:MAG: leucyl aminopeptidase family protein, partial [Rubrivivax sp.]